MWPFVVNLSGQMGLKQGGNDFCAICFYIQNTCSPRVRSNAFLKQLVIKILCNSRAANMNKLQKKRI